MRRVNHPSESEAGMLDCGAKADRVGQAAYCPVCKNALEVSLRKKIAAKAGRLV